MALAAAIRSMKLPPHRTAHTPWCPKSGPSRPRFPGRTKPVGALQRGVAGALTIRSLGRSGYRPMVTADSLSRYVPKAPATKNFPHLIHRHAQGIQHIFHHGVGCRLGLEKGIDVALIEVQARRIADGPFPIPLLQLAGFGDQFPRKSTRPFKYSWAIRSTMPPPHGP